ncbi:MAG: DNA-binding protein [Clostridia bacterium]|nr:DNA-binding protein [Clostridia bacterium]
MTIPLLMDLYGQVLSERKRDLLDYYYNEDYSLAEIAEITGISRQGIRESVKKSEAELRALDDSLQLVERTQSLERKIAALRDQMRAVLEEPLEDSVRNKLEQIRSAMGTLSF